MNRESAKKAALEVARQHAHASYEQLALRVGAEHDYHQVTVEGVEYQVTFKVIWDDQPGGLLRVWVAVDDGGPRAFMPMVFCDLLGPTQHFEAALE